MIRWLKEEALHTVLGWSLLAAFFGLAFLMRDLPVVISAPILFALLIGGIVGCVVFFNRSQARRKEGSLQE